MGFRSHCKILKLSNNSLRSFLSRENRRDEVRFYHLNYKAFCDEQEFNVKPMLHNLVFQASKPQDLSIIRILHLLLSYYTLDSSFIQANFPFMAQSNHSILIKALIKKSMHRAPNLFLLMTSNFKGKSNMSRASHKLRLCLYFILELYIVTFLQNQVTWP